MEPIDVASTEWIKDYDPLFELFDEEMQSGAAEEEALAATHHHHPQHHHHQHNTWSNSAYETYLTPISDYYFMAASFAASSAQQQQHQHHQQAYHTTTIQAPTAVVASTSATAPTTSEPSYARTDGYDLSQYAPFNSNQQYQLHNHATAQTAHVAPLYSTMDSSVTTTSSELTYATPSEQQQQHQQQLIQNQHQTQQQQATDELSLFLGLDWLPSLENELTEPESSSVTSSSLSAPVTPMLVQSQSESASYSSSSAYSSLAPSPSATSSPCDTGSTTSNNKSNNKKRKNAQSKGTSLLAQPSPKIVPVSVTNNNINSSVITNTVLSGNASCGLITKLPVHLTTMALAAITTAAAATNTTTTSTTAAAATRPLTKSVPILQLSRSASSQQQSSNVLLPVTTATTTTATLLTYSNLANVARQAATTISAPAATVTAKFVPVKTDMPSKTVSSGIRAVETKLLNRQELTSRLCLSIEHDYSMAAR